MAGRIGSAAAILAAAGSLAIAPSAGAATGPLGLPCSEMEGVVWCASGSDPENGVDTRVESFDGVPLDVSVTLPRGEARDLPLVMLFHGFAGNHPGLPATREWARRGYAVLAYTFRGMGNSCGFAWSRALDPQGCARGWIRMADVRWDARDAQHLAGLLADEGVVDPGRIGALGISYGGAQAWLLAVLRDRVAMPDGGFAPWRSPAGRPLRIAAAVPTTTWSDFAQSLQPNGNDLDYALMPPGAGHEPRGVLKQSMMSFYYGLGLLAQVYYAPPASEPGPDLSSWFMRASAGEPFDDDSLPGLGGDVARNRSPYMLDPGAEPAPLLLASGWADDLLPAGEAIRFYNRTRALHPGAPIALHLADIGHLRARGLPAQMRAWEGAAAAWLDRFVKRDGAAPQVAGVTAWERACEGDDGGATWRAATWRAAQPGEIRFAAGERHTFDSRAGDPRVAREVDPVGGSGPCAQVIADDEPGVPVWRLPASRGYTLLGAPTVITKLEYTGSAVVVARLWDEAPDGTKRLVTRGVLRPRAPGPAVFQLNPVAWRFRDGHRPLLQLLGRDAPYLRPPNSYFEVTLDGLELRLPVNEHPGPVAAGARPPADGTTIAPPAPPVLPGGLRPAPDVGSLSAAAHRRGRRCRRMRVTLTADGAVAVTRVAFRSRRARRLDRRAPFAAKLPAGPWRAIAKLADGRAYEYRGEPPCRRR